MANLRIRKSDLKGTVWVGEGWLCVGGWATRVGDDRRFVSVEATNAAFAGLDVEPIPANLVSMLEFYVSRSQLEGYRLTRLLVEGEDGTISRVYRDGYGDTVCLNENFVQILGSPPVLTQVSPETLVCPAGAIAMVTDTCPEWARELA